MQDAELLTALAEIAGVFVGFGALISMRGGGPSDAYEVMRIRGVVSTGVAVVVAALLPVAISRFDITGHELWLLCALLVLVVDWVMLIVTQRNPEHRAAVVAEARASRVRIGFWALTATLIEVPLQAALILVVLGPFPDLEPALYIAAVVLMLFEAAWILTYSVYSQTGPATA